MRELNETVEAQLTICIKIHLFTTVVNATNSSSSSSSLLLYDVIIGYSNTQREHLQKYVYYCCFQQLLIMQ